MRFHFLVASSDTAPSTFPCFVNDALPPGVFMAREEPLELPFLVASLCTASCLLLYRTFHSNLCMLFVPSGRSDERRAAGCTRERSQKLTRGTRIETCSLRPFSASLTCDHVWCQSYHRFVQEPCWKCGDLGSCSGCFGEDGGYELYLSLPTWLSFLNRGLLWRTSLSLVALFLLSVSYLQAQTIEERRATLPVLNDSTPFSQPRSGCFSSSSTDNPCLVCFHTGEACTPKPTV